LHNYG